MRRVFLIIFGTIISLNSIAQIEGTLSLMTNIPQSIDLNPAVTPKYRYVIGVPVISSFGGMFSSNGLSYNNIFTKEADGNDVSTPKILKKSANVNYFQLSAQTDILRFGMRINPDIYITFSSSIKGFARFKMEKETIASFEKGLSYFLDDKTVFFSKLDGLSFIDTNVGIAIQLSDQFSFGGRIKFLQGLHNITSRKSSFQVVENNGLDLTYSADVSVLTSGLDSNSNGSYSMNSEIGKLLFKNVGVGIDIGISFKPNDKLVLGASIVDFGFINWKNNPKELYIDSQKITFLGTKLTDLFGKSETPSFLGGFNSANKDKFKLKEREGSSYNTMLPIKAYFSGKYEIQKNLNLAGLIFVEQFRSRISTGLTLGVTKDFGKWLSSSLTYTVANKSYVNLGLGVSFNLTPIQIYFVGDNLLLNSAFLKSSKLVNFRFGINVAWGGELKRSKKPTNQRRPSGIR